MARQRKKSNLRLTSLLIIVPLVAGILTISFIFSSRYQRALGEVGALSLQTEGWEDIDKLFQGKRPEYGRKFAYYTLKEGENVEKVSAHFSVPVEKLRALNPGTMAAGTTIKVPPLEAPMVEAKSNGLISQASVVDENGLLKIKHDYAKAKVITNIPELMEFLKPYKAIIRTGSKTYRINRPLFIEENIRIDITGRTVKKLELLSTPKSLVCLCITDSEMLIKDTEITTFDEKTNLPDKTYKDRRSFIRALKSSRMDVINSTISYLGTALEAGTREPILREGGTYGISWRIPDDKLGIDITTGWIEKATLHKNHFGSYTFGASGMVWKDNVFSENDVYGLDPHDDSNNALVEGNHFINNGKHGFIVSKRCNYNEIRDNVSYGNGLHGFMLHQDSVYNILENNTAYDNVDNFAIYDSDFNLVKNNVSFNAKGSHLRINKESKNTYVENNQFFGGRRGVYMYGGVSNVYIRGNTIQSVREAVAVTGARNVMFVNNTFEELSIKLTDKDLISFGPNSVELATAPFFDGVGEIKAFSGVEIDSSEE